MLAAGGPANKARDNVVNLPENQAPAYRFAGTVRSRIVRTPFYLFSFCLLCVATTLVLVALFTSNWQRTAGYLIDRVNSEYFTYGLWFTCRHVNVDWIRNHPDDIYCHPSNYSASELCFKAEIYSL